ncbi:MAG: hypothetical protein ACKOAS_01145 [Verrucomicrobiota bacterium]|jgi:hypothetical protein
MKGVIFFCMTGLLALISGCAVSEQSVEDVGRQFEDGIQGRGQIVPNDPLKDSFGSDYN